MHYFKYADVLMFTAAYCRMPVTLHRMNTCITQN